MVSFDVVLLFTNVSLPETIEIISNYLYEENKNIMSIERKVFQKLMFIATQGIFMFNEKLYKQIDGVTKGKTTWPHPSLHFLGHLEKTHFENPDNKNELPELYFQYIDNVYAVFQSKSSCSKFLNVLDSQYKDMEFTMEKATSTLNFLDVEIKMNDIEYDTCMWRKLTSTRLLLNFHSMCSTT